MKLRLEGLTRRPAAALGSADWACGHSGERRSRPDDAGCSREAIERWAFGSDLRSDGILILRAVEAVLNDGPLKGTKVEIEAVEGRPPSTIEVSDAAGEVSRYCLAEWTQEGMSAEYAFLYPV